MSTTIETKNNYSTFKNDFKKDTGLEADKNIDTYISYFNARMNDYSYQVLHGLTHQLINKLGFLPGEIRLQIAEMITSHNTFKELLKHKS